MQWWLVGIVLVNRFLFIIEKTGRAGKPVFL